MTWVAIAVGVGGAVVGGGASIAGANKQAKAAKQAGQLNMEMFNTLNRQQQPYIQSGYGALSRLNTLLGLSPNPRARMPMASPGGSGGYMPTPGGGVQPIMQVEPTDRRMYAGGPGGDPYMGGGQIPLQRILTLRAMHGDTQAAQMLQRIA